MRKGGAFCVDGKDEIQGSLHYGSKSAAFGRDDGLFSVVEGLRLRKDFYCGRMSRMRPVSPSFLSGFAGGFELVAWVPLDGGRGGDGLPA